MTYEEEDIANKIVTYKTQKSEAIAAFIATKNTEKDQRVKNVSVEEMPQAQRNEYELYMKNMVDELKTMQAKQLQELEEPRRQYNLETETRIR